MNALCCADILPCLDNKVVATQDSYFPPPAGWLDDITYIVNVLLLEEYRLPIQCMGQAECININLIWRVPQLTDSWTVYIGNAVPQGSNATECHYLAGYNLAESVVSFTPKIDQSNVYATRQAILSLYDILLQQFMADGDVKVKVRSKEAVDYIEPDCQSLNTAQGITSGTANGCVMISSSIAVKFIAHCLDLQMLVKEVDGIIDDKETGCMLKSACKLDGTKGVSFISELALVEIVLPSVDKNLAHDLVRGNAIINAYCEYR